MPGSPLAMSSANVALIKQLAKDYKNTMLIAIDLGFVVNATEELGRKVPAPGTLRPERDATAAQALWIAAAVSYVRCFKTNRRRAALRAADAKAHALNKSGIHEYITDLRNTHFAHSEADLEDVSVGVLIRKTRGQPDQFEGLQFFGVKQTGGTPDQAKQLHDLAGALHQEQLAKAAVLNTELQRVGRLLDPTELAELERTAPEKAGGVLAKVRQSMKDLGLLDGER
jgi:hypothetical protein